MKKCSACGNTFTGNGYISRKHGIRRLYCSYKCYLVGIGFTAASLMLLSLALIASDEARRCSSGCWWWCMTCLG